MVEEELIVLSIGLTLDGQTLENGEGVDSELQHVEDLEVRDYFIGRPVRVGPVNVSALPATPQLSREPILLLEEMIISECRDRVEDGVEAEFADGFHPILPLIALILIMNDIEHPFLHHPKVGVFDDLSPEKDTP